jgi:hypothetical protein
MTPSLYAAEEFTDYIILPNGTVIVDPVILPPPLPIIFANINDVAG